MIKKGVKGVYACGSSGECIYQSVKDRKITLENIMEAAKGRLTVIAHVACNNTKDSVELARHAESLGVDAIAANSPYLLPSSRIFYCRILEHYQQCCCTKYRFHYFIIFRMAGTALTLPLLRTMRKNPNVIGVKNSSMATQDIQMFKAEGGENFVVFNGPDEQLVSGLAIGAQGGIGGTYGVMPELLLKIKELTDAGNLSSARNVQNAVDSIIYKMCEAHGNLYAVIKKILEINEHLCIGSVRAPLSPLTENDVHIAETAAEMIRDAIKKYC